MAGVGVESVIGDSSLAGSMCHLDNAPLGLVESTSNIIGA